MVGIVDFKLQYTQIKSGFAFSEWCSKLECHGDWYYIHSSIFLSYLAGNSERLFHTCPHYPWKVITIKIPLNIHVKITDV